MYVYDIIYIYFISIIDLHGDRSKGKIASGHPIHHGIQYIVLNIVNKVLGIDTGTVKSLNILPDGVVMVSFLGIRWSLAIGNVLWVMIMITNIKMVRVLDKRAINMVVNRADLTLCIIKTTKKEFFNVQNYEWNQ